MTRNGATADETVFPLDSFKAAATHLRRPFMPGAVKWKIQSVSKDKKRAQVVSFVDARLVIERLNLVVPHLWHTEYHRLDGDHVLCKLTVDGLTREDVGTANKGGNADRVKSMYSDALKRAGVHFGIAVSIYAMKQTWLEVGNGKKNELGKRGDSPELTEDNKTYLSGLYEGWLEMEDRGGLFGPPLDHGDDPEGSVGDVADAGAPEPEQTTLDTEDDHLDPNAAEKLRHEIEELAEAVRAIDKRKALKGAVEAKVAAAGDSPAKLELIRADLDRKLTEASQGVAA